MAATWTRQTPARPTDRPERTESCVTESLIENWAGSRSIASRCSATRLSRCIQHERIQTTVPRAKELRPFVERIITIAKRSLNAPEGSTHGVTARRPVARDIADRAVVTKLFDTIAPRYIERPGGYTRLLRLGYRRGDSAEVARSSWSAASTTRSRGREATRRAERREAQEEDDGRPDPRGAAPAAARRTTETRASARRRSTRPPRAPARRSRRRARPADPEDLGSHTRGHGHRRDS